MKVFKRLKDWYDTTIYYIKLKRVWKNLLKECANGEDPTLKKMEVFTDKNQKCLYTQRSLIDLYSQVDDDAKLNQILDEFAPSYDYINAYMDFADVVSPNVINFVDDDGNQSLSYGCIYTFNSDYLSTKNLLKLALVVLCTILIISGLGLGIALLVRSFL